MAAIERFNGEMEGAILTNLVEALENAKTKDSHPEEWFPVVAAPSPDTWLQDKDWKPFSLTQSEKTLGAGGPALPLKAAPGGVPAEFLSTVTVAMDTKRVRISRPWMDLSFFSNRAWRLKPTCGYTTVSTGNLADKDPGRMPLVITGVLLSRKLLLKGRWTSPATAPKALGPFSLEGLAATTQSGQTSLSVDAPQIIGFFCTAVPKSPDPDSKAFRTH